MVRTNAQSLLDRFCKSIFKCSYILKQLLNPSSAITQTLVKNYDYNSEPQAELYEVIANFDSFRQQICSYGFTFEWGLNYLRDQGESILAQINEWVDIITRNRNRIRKFIESYFFKIEDFGIFDLLDSLSEFFNCILSNDDETCASIATSQNFYKKCISALHVTNTGHGNYKLTDSWIKQKLGLCDNITMQLNGLANNLSKALYDAGLTAKNVSNAQAAFNIANFVRDAKRAIDKGDYTQIPGVKLCCKAYNSATEFASALGDAFSNMFSTGSASSNSDEMELSFDFIVSNAKFDTNGKLIIEYEGNTADVTAVLGNTTITTTDGIYVPISEKDNCVETLKTIYWTDNHMIVSTGMAVNSLVKFWNNEELTADEKLIADDIINRVSAMQNLSEVNDVLKAY